MAGVARAGGQSSRHDRLFSLPRLKLGLILSSPARPTFSALASSATCRSRHFESIFQPVGRAARRTFLNLAAIARLVVRWHQQSRVAFGVPTAAQSSTRAGLSELARYGLDGRQRISRSFRREVRDHLLIREAAATEAGTNWNPLHRLDAVDSPLVRGRPSGTGGLLSRPRHDRTEPSLDSGTSFRRGNNQGPELAWRRQLGPRRALGNSLRKT